MRVAIFIIALLLLTGCQLGGPRATEGGLHSDNPAAKLYAIRRAGAQRDADAVPDLVELLDHDDPAVRLMSIQALERITGQRHGYAPYADVHERDAAIARWEHAVAGGSVANPAD